MFEAQSDIQKPIRLLPRTIVQVHQKSAYGADYKVGARIDGSAVGQSYCFAIGLIFVGFVVYRQ
jgi:hypothetical protein